jgi:hypothetical protein
VTDTDTPVVAAANGATPFVRVNSSSNTGNASWRDPNTASLSDNVGGIHLLSRIADTRCPISLSPRWSPTPNGRRSTAGRLPMVRPGPHYCRK